MKSMRNILNRLIDNLLLQVVDVDQSMPKDCSFGVCPASRLEFRVLTPAVQRRLVESA